MKFSLLRVGVLTCLATGMFYGEASAESEQISKSSSYSVAETNQNFSFQEINALLTKAALEAEIPPEVVKAVAAQESGWKQFYENGEANISQKDGGIGIMQITNQPNYDQEKLKTDISYNIKAGVEILSSMYDRTDLPKVSGAERQVIENWYFPVMAYNGTKPVNSPLVKLTGEKNLDAYQEKVFARIENDSFLNKIPENSPKLGQFVFTTDDFQYDPESDENIEFSKTEYTLDQTHDSAYLLEVKEQVVVTEENVGLRPQPSSQGGTTLAKNTTLIITGDFEYDQNTDSKNQFVWYPVETVDHKKGYISSAYIAKASGNTPAFTDIKANYQDAVNYLVSKGINGTSPTTFGTYENITRLDAAQFVVKALGLDFESAPEAGFTDVPTNRTKYVNALKETGITSGKSKTFSVLMT